MSSLELLLVAVAGAVGAVLRLELTTSADTAVARRATAAVNVTGAGALGLASAVLGASALLVLGGGLLGATTTFSTWMVQAEGHPRPVVVVAVPLALGVLAAAAGRLLGTAVAT